MKCHYHPRANATSICSVCGIGLCRRCAIEDRGRVYCDSCYVSEEADDDSEEVMHAEAGVASEDYVDLELGDLLDSEEDEGLF